MTGQATKIEEVFYQYIWSYFMPQWVLVCFYLTLVVLKIFNLFILISVITSAALIPILLTKKPPTFRRIKAMTLKDLYDASPFGMVSSFFMEQYKLHYLHY